MRLKARLSFFLFPTLNCGSLSHRILINQSFFLSPSKGNVSKGVLFVFITRVGIKKKEMVYSSTGIQYDLCVFISIHVGSPILLTAV